MFQHLNETNLNNLNLVAENLLMVNCNIVDSKSAVVVKMDLKMSRTVADDGKFDFDDLFVLVVYELSDVEEVDKNLNDHKMFHLNSL